MKSKFIVTLLCLLCAQYSYANVPLIKCTHVNTNAIPNYNIEWTDRATIELRPSGSQSGLIDRALNSISTSIGNEGRGEVDLLLKAALAEFRNGRKVVGYEISRDADSTTLNLTLINVENGEATVKSLKWNLSTGKQSIVIENSVSSQYSISCEIVNR